MGGFECKLKRLSGDLRGLKLVYADGAHLGGDAGFKVQKSRAGSLPIEPRAQAGQLFEQGVDGGAQSAGKQAALVAGVEPGGAGAHADDGWFHDGFQEGLGLLGLVIRRQAAQQRGPDRGRHDSQIALARGGDGFDLLLSP